MLVQITDRPTGEVLRGVGFEDLFVEVDAGNCGGSSVLKKDVDEAAECDADGDRM